MFTGKTTTTPVPEMRRTWLIQRLEKPRTFMPQLLDNPFSFGGGLMNGGLSAEAMKLLRPIFSFDYMGAAEYEFGAVPKAFQKILDFATHDQLTAWTFEIPIRDVLVDWRLDDAVKNKTASLLPTNDVATIYVLSPAEWRDTITDRVTKYATVRSHELEPADRIRDWTHLERTLRPYNEWDGDIRGWLELDNGYLFFTDHEMADATASLFGLDFPSLEQPA